MYERSFWYIHVRKHLYFLWFRKNRDCADGWQLSLWITRWPAYAYLTHSMLLLLIAWRRKDQMWICSLLYGPLTRYVKLQVAHAPGMPGTFSPAADFKGNRWLAIPACITARAWRTCRDACRDRFPAVTGKTFPAFPAHAHPQICVSGKRPMVSRPQYIDIDITKSFGIGRPDSMPHIYEDVCWYVWVSLRRHVLNHYNKSRSWKKVLEMHQPCDAGVTKTLGGILVVVKMWCLV